MGSTNSILQKTGEILPGAPSFGRVIHIQHWGNFGGKDRRWRAAEEHMPYRTKSGEMRGDLPGKPGPLLWEGSGCGWERRPWWCGAGSAALGQDKDTPGPGCAPLALPPPVRGCSLPARPGTFRLLPSGTPLSRADGVVEHGEFSQAFGGLGRFGVWLGFARFVCVYEWFLRCYCLVYVAFFVWGFCGWGCGFGWLVVVFVSLFHRTASRPLPKCRDTWLISSDFY